jgi:hypothetical protein
VGHGRTRKDTVGHGRSRKGSFFGGCGAGDGARGVYHEEKEITKGGEGGARRLDHEILEIHERGGGCESLGGWWLVVGGWGWGWWQIG